MNDHGEVARQMTDSINTGLMKGFLVAFHMLWPYFLAVFVLGLVLTYVRARLDRDVEERKNQRLAKAICDEQERRRRVRP